MKSRELRGKGVMIQALKWINFEEMPIVFEEALSMKMSHLGFQFVITVIYPRTNKHDFLVNLDSFLEFTSFQIPHIVCGDFNIDTLKTNLIKLTGCSIPYPNTWVSASTPPWINYSKIYYITLA